MLKKKISELDLANASLSGFIPMSDSAGTVTNKVTVQSIINLASGVVGGGGGSASFVSATLPSGFPVSGVSDNLYIATDSSKLYRWDTDNAVYVELGPVGGGSHNATVTIPGDPYYSDVVLLLHFDGNLLDLSSSPKTLTTYGSAAADGVAKFGSKSLSLNGSTQYIKTNTSSDFALPADFAIEAWVYLTSASPGFEGAYSAAVIATYPDGVSPNAGWQLRLDGTASAYDTIYMYTGISTLTWPASISLNQWHYIVVARSSGTVRAYLDGVQVGSSLSNSDDMTPSTVSPVTIGRLNLNPLWFYLPGRIDELRITRSSRGYTGTTIPVPSNPFPNSAAELVLPVTFS